MMTSGRYAIVALPQKALITLEQLQQSGSVRAKFAENFKPLANRRSINCGISLQV
jgi:BarA-like signal transduction histidine kinase